ncbi:MAG TPA: glucose-6-phosphate dehydrogenase assembly protein OpcA [Candidatus Eisenbacteria bacterium]|nr:glucose-6-phosphate dehydrogenase assembly protein OpcA [Candidatus Eisenbacteria bacterium]
MNETPAAGRAPADTTAPFLLLGDQGERPFDAVALERELESMWKSPPGANAFYRAALANLIVPLDTEPFERLADVIADVARRHPARLFRIGPARHAPGEPKRLTARATALCHLREGGGAFVCSEQVLLEYTEETAPLVPSAVRSLLIGDLPVVLLLLTPGPRPPWAEALAGLADIVVADSCVEEEPAAMAAVWERTGRKGAPMHDLAWARLEPWRASLASLFDTPEAAPALRSLHDVTVVHGGAAPPSSAWLLAGWLASRLGWKVASRDGARFRFRAPEGGTPEIAFVRDETDPEARIREVRARAAGAHPLDARLTHEARADDARLELLAPRALVTPIPFVRRELAAAVVGEIQRRIPNAAFRDAARAARALLEA